MFPALLLLLLQQVTPADLAIQYTADRAALERLWSAPFSEERQKRFDTFHENWLADVEGMEFPNVDRAADVDLVLFKNYLKAEIAKAKRDVENESESAKILPFVGPLVLLCEARSLRRDIEPREAADTLARAVEEIEKFKAEIKGANVAEVGPAIARRAAKSLEELRRALGSWYRWRADYDPLFTWWCEAPWEALAAELEALRESIEEHLGGINPDDEDLLLGDPIGREALLEELSKEMIAYSPEELLVVAEKEMKWCEERMAEAVAALGCADWKEALELVKAAHVGPGDQPALIRDMAEEAVKFLEDRNLITIPDLAKQIWRMEMMSPERQRFSPYFTGGEVISIAFPTSGMSHEAKMMSMRGNNRHFSRAAVHHELIPGHHLQGYMASRWNTHRRLFRTAFLVEGWALYWELRLWDLDFPLSSEDQVGMLFWRAHRCARIIFSLNFHLGNWSPEDCVAFLMEKIGHEERNARAEVRRSIQGGYGPLYQCAYMVGGLQMRALHKEMVLEGHLTEKAFHDTVLRQNSIPIAAIRMALKGELSESLVTSWRFYSLED